MVCGADNVLYVAGANTLFTYDLNTGQQTAQPINFLPTGDLTFRDGKLYCTGFVIVPSFVNAIMEVDLAQPSNSQVAMNLSSLPLGYAAWGIITTGAYCDSVRTFITVVNQGSPSFQPNSVYEVDFATQTLIYRCDTPYPILGATTPDEFRFSDCSVLLDLDTLGAGAGYQAPVSCDTLPLALADSSALLYSGYYIDSMSLRLLSPLPDAPEERLSAQAAAGITVQGQGTASLLLLNGGAAKDFDFLQALLSARYHNDAIPRTPGPRTLEVVLFTGGGNDTAFVELTLLPELQTALSATICAGEAYAFGTQSLTASGTYTDTLASALTGCDSVLMLSLSVLPTLQTALSATICTGEAYAFGTQQLTASGTYTDTLASAQTGCDSVLTLSLSVLPTLQTALSATICTGEAYAFGTQQLTASGMYTDTLSSDLTGCDSVLTLNLSVQPTLQTALSATICAGESYTFGAQSLMASGTYTDTLSSALTGCDSVLTLSLSQWPAIQAEWETAAPLCPGDSSGWIDLTALSGGSQPIVFQLQNEPPVTTAFFDQLPAGLWTVSAVDAEGCMTSWTFTLDDPPAWALDLVDLITIQAGEAVSIPLEVSLPGQYGYVWTPPTGLSCTDCQQPLASPSDSAWYAVTVTDTNGCATEDAILIQVEKSLGIYIPTAFSPDGDGTNEVFQILSEPSVIDRIDLFQVYNRWGELVFERHGAAPNDAGNGWDGTFRGKALPTDVFVWYAEIRLKNGERLIKKVMSSKIAPVFREFW